MRTLKTLKPGQNGARDLLNRYGPNLLCVRYRYDEYTRERPKTVELVVQRRSPPRETEHSGRRKLNGRGGSAARRSVALRRGWREAELRWRVKSAGGRWDPARLVWMLQRDVAERLDLLNRIVGGGV